MIHIVGPRLLILKALAVVLAMTASCSQEEQNEYDLIRLADPTRIETAASKQWDLMRVFFTSPGGGDLFERIDDTQQWHTFDANRVLGRKANAQGNKIPDEPEKEKGKFIIPAGSGLTTIIPVEPDSQYYLKCTGSFGSTFHLRAGALMLPKRLSFPPTGKSDALAGCMTRFKDDYIELEAEKGGDSSWIVIPTKADTRALVLMVYSPRQYRGTLEQVTMAALGEGADADTMVELKTEALGSIVSTQSVGKVVRPSLLVPLDTEIRFKPVTLPDNPVFFCSLGLPPGMSNDIELTLEAKDESNGAAQQIFKWRPGSDHRGWADIRKELPALSGKKVGFRLSCTPTPGLDATKAAVSLVFCGAPVISAGNDSKGAAPFNVILVSLDTLRYDHLGCYGYHRPVSPNLDRMAKESLMFDYAYAQASFTLPSHASLLTSLFPSIHGGEDLKGGRMSPGITFLAEVLADHGINTAAFTGGGLISHEFGFHEGFDVYCELDPLGDKFEDRKVADRFRLADGSAGSQDLALQWIEDHKDQPFFFFLHTYMVHDFSPPADLTHAFNEGETRDLSLGMNTLSYLRQHFLKKPVPERELAYCINMYDATIKAADDMIGALMDRLERLGIKDRTLVMVTSDHGEEFQDHGGLLHGCTLYEEMIRIPLIMHVPWLDSAPPVEQPVSHVDIMPTILDLLKIDYDGLMQGRSILPLLHGKEIPDRPVYAEVSLPTYTTVRCMIRDQWKYIEEQRYTEEGSEPAPITRELYHLGEDPREQADSIEAQTDRADTLESSLQQMETNLKKIDETMGFQKGADEELSSDLNEFLKQLGYL